MSLENISQRRSRFWIRPWFMFPITSDGCSTKSGVSRIAERLSNAIPGAILERRFLRSQKLGFQLKPYSLIAHLEKLHVCRPRRNESHDGFL
jgi:hypothetical protein